MKRLTGLTITIVLGLVLLGTTAFGLRRPAERAEVSAALPLVYDATGAMLSAINPKAAALPLMYDATGAMLSAINPKAAALPLVYDATGAMLNAIQPSK